MKPQRRSDLLLTDLEDELVIYDQTNFNGHNLNKTSKLVFEHCDGQHSVRDLAKMLELELEIEDGTNFANLALKQLNQKGLLEVESMPEAPTITRREVMKLAKMAGLAIALLPVVSTMVAPVATAAVSGNCNSGFTCVTNPGGLNTEVQHMINSLGLTGSETVMIEWSLVPAAPDGKAVCGTTYSGTYTPVNTWASIPAGLDLGDFGTRPVCVGDAISADYLNCSGDRPTTNGDHGDCFCVKIVM